MIRWSNGQQTRLETMFSIAKCRQSGNKWQSKTVSNDYYLRSSIVLTFLIAAYPIGSSCAQIAVSISESTHSEEPVHVL